MKVWHWFRRRNRKVQVVIVLLIAGFAVSAYFTDWSVVDRCRYANEPTSIPGC